MKTIYFQIYCKFKGFKKHDFYHIKYVTMPKIIQLTITNKECILHSITCYSLYRNNYGNYKPYFIYYFMEELV